MDLMGEIPVAPAKETFEDTLKRLEEIVAKMESGGLALDDSMKLYEEGMKKINKLTSMLSKSREKVMKLVTDEEGNVDIKAFDEKEGS